jgi:putative SOS response-associated peptidase YedK
VCGRFTLTDPDPRLLRFRFDLPASAEIDRRRRFNIAPTDPVLAVRVAGDGRREGGTLRWGLVPQYADPDRFERLLINARAERLAEAPAFKDAFAERRCLVLADGFYEWRATETGKQPVWITRPDRSPFAFAGIWAESALADGSTLPSCAIVTCAPSELVAPIHNRMPVILDPETEAAWLDPDSSEPELLALLRPTDDLELTEVSEAVNHVDQDGPQLLEPPLKLF